MPVLTIKGRDNRYVDGAEAEARRSVESTSWGKIPSYLRVLWSNNDSFSRAAKSARSHGVSPSTKIDLLFSPVIDLVSHPSPSLQSIPPSARLPNLGFLMPLVLYGIYSPTFRGVSLKKQARLIAWGMENVGDPVCTPFSSPSGASFESNLSNDASFDE